MGPIPNDKDNLRIVCVSDIMKLIVFRLMRMGLNIFAMCHIQQVLFSKIWIVYHDLLGTCACSISRSSQVLFVS